MPTSSAIGVSHHQREKLNIFDWLFHTLSAGDVSITACTSAVHNNALMQRQCNRPALRNSVRQYIGIKALYLSHVKFCGIDAVREMLSSAKLSLCPWHACSLRTTGFPYVALLAFSGARTKLIAAIEGRTSASQLLGVLQQAVGDHEGHLAVEQADANERVGSCQACSWELSHREGCC